MSLRHRAHRVIYVPLDDRPCNAKFPRLLARMVDFELVMPPRELLGDAQNAAQPARIAEWLIEPHGRIDCAILSLDMLAYGGLVPSRTMSVPGDTALNRLDLLAKLRELYAESAIYAFNVIMRLSITANSPQTGRYWEAMRQYSELVWRVNRRGEDELAPRVAELEGQIPPEIISDFRTARERNHWVNLRAIDETAAHNIDFLALTQEDAAAFGPHIDEQERLRERIAARHIDDRVMIYPGADEAQLLSACVRCGACVRVCPTHGLQPALTEAGLGGLWTPILVPRLGPCDFSCTACGDVCPTGAIPALSLEEKRLAVIGKAYVDPARCIPWSGRAECIVCEEMCPLPQKAITLEVVQARDAAGAARELQAPVVDHQRCIGCGMCESKCPVNGEAAIRVIVDPLA